MEMTAGVQTFEVPVTSIRSYIIFIRKDCSLLNFTQRPT